MKKLGLAVLFLLALTPAIKGQDCDCTIVPFKPDPPCFDKCTAKILATATKEELQVILGLRENVASRVAGWAGSDNADSLQDYREVLNRQEVKTLGRKFGSLNNRQLEYFLKPVSERERIRKEMEALFHD